MSSIKRKCIKGFVHEFETFDETTSHVIKKCWRCKINKYIPRRDKEDYDRVVAILPIRV